MMTLMQDNKGGSSPAQQQAGNALAQSFLQNAVSKPATLQTIMAPQLPGNMPAMPQPMRPAFAAQYAPKPQMAAASTTPEGPTPFNQMQWYGGR